MYITLKYRYIPPQERWLVGVKFQAIVAIRLSSIFFFFCFLLFTDKKTCFLRSVKRCVQRGPDDTCFFASVNRFPRRKSKHENSCEICTNIALETKYPVGREIYLSPRRESMFWIRSFSNFNHLVPASLFPLLRFPVFLSHCVSTTVSLSIVTVLFGLTYDFYTT